MNHRVRVEILLSSVTVCPYLDTRRAAGNAGDFQAEPHIDAEVARPAHQSIHEVGIESFQRPLATMHDRRTDSGSRGDVRELKRNVAATDKDDPFRQMLQFEKLLTRHCEFGAGDLQIDGPGPSATNDVVRLQN